MTLVKRLKIKLARWWQGVEVGEPSTRFGKGKFVDVLLLRGGRIRLISHDQTPRRPKGTLTLTAYQPNHGFLVKYVDENGRHRWTNNLSYDAIYELLNVGGERSTLTQGGNNTSSIKGGR